MRFKKPDQVVFIFFLLACFLFSSSLHAAVIPKDPELQMNAMGNWQGLNYTYSNTKFFTGIVPLRVSLVNQKRKGRFLQVRFKIDDTFLSGQVSESLFIQANGWVSITLPVVIIPRVRPSYKSTFGTVSIFENNKLITSTMVKILDFKSGILSPCIIISKGEKRLSPTLSAAFDILRPESIPPHFWYTYINEKAILIHKSAINDLTPLQKEALWKYAAWGGTLILLDMKAGDILPSSMADNLKFINDPDLKTATCKFLAGKIIESRGNLPGTLGDKFEYIKELRKKSFFEKIIMGSQQLHNILHSGYTEENPFPSINQSTYLSKKLNQTPTVLFELILICFTIIAGPINFILLKRLHRPVLLLVTAPVLSITFVLFLFTTIFISQGTGLKQTIASFTILDQALGLEATTVKSALFSSFPPDYISIPNDCLFLPLGADFKLRTTLSDEKQIRGFLPSRIAKEFLAAEIKTTRKRLLISEEKGVLKIVNGLGVYIKQVILKRNSTIFISHNIPAGAKGSFSTYDSYFNSYFDSDSFNFNTLFAKRYFPISNQGKNQYQQNLWRSSPVKSYNFSPGSSDFFIAETSESPFWKKAKDAEIIAGHHIIYGLINHAP